MPKDDAVTAGRGFLLIAAAKLYFILASALIALGLPRFLGPARFGDFKVVNSLISVLNMVLILGTIQTVSKLVSEDRTRALSIRGTALGVQIVLGGGIAVTLAAFAPWICAIAFKDPALAPYLRIGAGITLSYAVYAVFVGILNGQKRFATQAKLDALFSTLKATLIVGLVLAGLGVAGAFIGFLAAAAAIAVVSAAVASRDLPPPGSDTITASQLGTLLAPILGSTLMINLILQLDVLAIKGLISLDTEAASRITGLFGGAKNISLLPYQATFALTFVVFPMLSQATFDGDRERSARYVRQALRFLLLMASLSCVPLIATARPLLEILLGAAYGQSAGALVIMLPTTVLTAVLVLCVTILNASGGERLALLITTMTVALNAVLLTAALQWDLVQFGPVLERIAWATLTAIAAGAAAVLSAVRRRFGPFAPTPTVFRLIAAAGVTLVLARLWPAASLVTLIAKAAACAVVFGACVMMLGEITDDDRSALKRIFGRAT